MECVLFGVVIFLADEIERERIPVHDKTVFSYRYRWSDDKNTLFDDITWNEYRRRTIERAEASAFVVLTDISDFYPRVYHHRLENALRRLPSRGETPDPNDATRRISVPERIMKLLQVFSGNVSYGLPVGGPASRILAELSLVGVDNHLRSRRVSFCRYADDYCIFCDSREEAYTSLVLLSEKLFNEGFVLNKKKTQILPASEYCDTWRLLDPAGELVTDEAKLLGISIRFDPYSETAEEDYDALAAAVRQVDIIGILSREVAKTAIDMSVTKQAINAIRVLDGSSREGALKTLLAADNLRVLSPVFVTLMRVVRGVYMDLSELGKAAVDECLIAIFEHHKDILSVEINVAYYLQALAMRHSDRKVEIMVEVYERPSPILRRIVIAAMVNWKCHFWLSDLKNKYHSLDEWQKRSMILASYTLGDEGEHWRGTHSAVLERGGDACERLVFSALAARIPQ